MDITEARALEVGATLHYIGKRPARDVPSWTKSPVSFRRLTDDRVAEVFTTDGSRYVDIDALATAPEPERLTLLVERKRLSPGSIEAAAVRRPEMGARLANLTSGARVEFGVTSALLDMSMTVTLPTGEQIVETVHLPTLAIDWAAAIESAL